jgi:hypothetical protein
MTKDIRYAVSLPCLRGTAGETANSAAPTFGASPLPDPPPQMEEGKENGAASRLQLNSLTSKP